MKKFITFIMIKMHQVFGIHFKEYPYIKALEEAIEYKDNLIQSLSRSEDSLEQTLDDLQHENTHACMSALRLQEALEQLMDGVDQLPPLTAINGMLAEQMKNARYVINLYGINTNESPKRIETEAQGAEDSPN